MPIWLELWKRNVSKLAMWKIYALSVLCVITSTCGGRKSVTKPRHFCAKSMRQNTLASIFLSALFFNAQQPRPWPQSKVQYNQLSAEAVKNSSTGLMRATHLPTDQPYPPPGDTVLHNNTKGDTDILPGAPTKEWHTAVGVESRQIECPGCRFNFSHVPFEASSQAAQYLYTNISIFFDTSQNNSQM